MTVTVLPAAMSCEQAGLMYVHALRIHSPILPKGVSVPSSPRNASSRDTRHPVSHLRYQSECADLRQS